MKDVNFNEFVEMWDQDAAVQDSLNLVEAKQDSSQLALDNIKTKQAYSDSIDVRIKDIEKEYAETSTTEKILDLPIVKGVKGASELGQYVSNLLTNNILSQSKPSQAAFDKMSTALNLLALPINQMGRLLGYNPGLSGERTVGSIYDKLGIDYRSRGKIDEVFGTKAPIGGENMFESERNKEIEALQKLKENK